MSNKLKRKVMKKKIRVYKLSLHRVTDGKIDQNPWLVKLLVTNCSDSTDAASVAHAYSLGLTTALKGEYDVSFIYLDTIFPHDMIHPVVKLY